ncbi:MAG: DNA mismatch repair protein MutS, partial [Blastocatellia bacterium]|nr:DNA mismatch repair protein MutS [Blastocatellia bacterium]
MDNPTPMLRQYLDIKKKYPGTLLLFRLGDFYELFNEDAVIGSRELQITLTARHKDSPNPVPMCGVPYHAAAGYISKLVRKGYRVAICEQAEPAAKGIKLVKREVVRVVTPGTTIDSQLTEQNEPSYLAAVSGTDDCVGVAFLDLSTGEFSVTEESGPEAWSKAAEHISRHSPSEILLPRSPSARMCHNLGLSAPEGSSLFLEASNRDAGPSASAGVVTAFADEHFSKDEAGRILKSHFDVKDLSVFGLEGKEQASAAAAACLCYVRETQKAQGAHIRSIEYFESAEFMVLDAITLANLEITRSRNEASDNSLYSLINETITGM